MTNGQRKANRLNFMLDDCMVSTFVFVKEWYEITEKDKADIKTVVSAERRRIRRERKRLD